MRTRQLQKENSLKHVNDKYGTIHDPGHSGRPSGGGGGIVVVVVVCAGGRGFGFCACTADDGPAFVLSQHTEPRLHVDVYDTSTDGRSQNAAIRFSRQNPGHLGNGGPAAAVVVVVDGAAVGRDCDDGCLDGGGFESAAAFSAGAVTQQLLSSPGQYASASTSSQNNANRPLTHSPRHCLLPTGGVAADGGGGNGCGFGAAVVVDAAVAGGGRCGALFTLILVEFLSSTTKCSAPMNASLDTQHLSPVLHISVTFSTASQ